VEAEEIVKRSSSRSRRAFEEMKRSRIGISEDSQFTADEIEVAGIITCFHHYWRLFLRWGAKRRRYAIRRDESSATHNSKLLPRRNESENDYELRHGGMAMAPPPERRLSPISRPNSKNVRAKNRPGKRAPKKKTPKELGETVDELSVENARLIKEAEQMRKIRQGLEDYNVYLKSYLTLYLEQGKEQNMPYTYPASSSSHSDTRQKTETTASCDDFQCCDEHGHFEKCSGSSALSSAYDKPKRLGRLMYPCSLESSFGFEKDDAMPTKDIVCSGFLDQNTLDEALFGTNISNDLHDQMLMSKNRAAAAAEARRHRIELKRGKYPHLSKGRSRGQEDLNENVL